MADNEPTYGEPLDDDALVQWEGRCFEASKAHFSDWRTTAVVMSHLYAGETYSQADLDWLRDTNRPAVNLNLTRNTIESLVGADLEDRSEARFEADTPDSPPRQFVADCYTHIVRVLMERCRGLQHQNVALLHVLMYGYGWCEAFLDATRLPVLPVLKAVHPMEMYADPDAMERNLEDRRWLIRERLIPLEDAQARWPDKREDLETLDAGRAALFAAMPMLGRVMGGAPRGGPRSPANRCVRVREFQFSRTEPRVRIWQQDGIQRDLGREEFERLRKGGTIEDRRVVEYSGQRWYRAWLARPSAGRSSTAIVLKRDELTSTAGPTYLAATGSPHYRVEEDGEPRMVCFGLAKTLYDAQHVMNRTASNILEYMGRSNKGGGTIEEDALPQSHTIEDFAKARATIGGWALVASGAHKEGKIDESKPPQWPSAFEQLFGFLARVWGDIGVSPEMRAGQSEGYRSEALLSNQQRTTLVVFQTIYENLRNMREDSGRVLAQLARTDVTSATLDRFLEGMKLEGVTHIMGQDPATGQPVEIPLLDGQPDERPEARISVARIIRAEDPFEIGVTVDTGVQAPSTRKAIFALFMQHGILKDSGVPPHVLLRPLIRYMPDMPEAVKQEMISGMDEFAAQQQMAQTIEGLDAQLSQMTPEKKTQVLTLLVQKHNLVPPEQGVQPGGALSPEMIQ